MNEKEIRASMTSEQIQLERKLTCEAINGAMAFGYQNTNPPPSDDHWLAPFWKIGRKQAELESAAAKDDLNDQHVELYQAAQASDALAASTASGKPVDAEPVTDDQILEEFERRALSFPLRIDGVPNLNGVRVIEGVRTILDKQKTCGGEMTNDRIEQLAYKHSCDDDEPLFSFSRRDLFAFAGELLAASTASGKPVDAEPVAWAVPNKDGTKPTFGKGWMFSPVQQINATMPLYAAPLANPSDKLGINLQEVFNQLREDFSVQDAGKALKAVERAIANPSDKGAEQQPVDLQAFAEGVRNGIADYIADHMADKKHSLAEIDLYVRHIEINAGMLASPSDKQEVCDCGVTCQDNGKSCRYAAPPAKSAESGKEEATNAPFANCQFRECDLPGQCKGEGKCHHPAAAPPSNPSDKGAEQPDEALSLANADWRTLYDMVYGHECSFKSFMATVDDLAAPRPADGGNQ